MTAIVIFILLAIFALLFIANIYYKKYTFQWIYIQDRQPQKGEEVLCLTNCYAEYRPEGVRVFCAIYTGLEDNGFGHFSFCGHGIEALYWYPIKELPPLPHCFILSRAYCQQCGFQCDSLHTAVPDRPCWCPRCNADAFVYTPHNGSKPLTFRKRKYVLGKKQPLYMHILPTAIKKKDFQKIDMSELKTTPSGQVIKDKSSNKTSIIEQTHQQKQCCICGKPLPFDTNAGGEHIKDGFCIPLYFCSNKCFFTSIFTPSRIHITSNA